MAGTPPPTPISFRQFGGLVLDRSLDDVGQGNAIDLLDVDWDGSVDVVRAREGAETFTAEPGVANYETLFPHSDTRLLAKRGAVLAAISQATGKELASTAAITAATHLAFTRIGTPAASYSYIADSVHTLRRFDGTSFTEPTATVDGVPGEAMPEGVFLATWTDGGNRLVVASTGGELGGPGGAVSNPSYVWFSSPGEPESFESTAYVQLDPGDGEEIVGCCVWGGQVFVFKETRLFVFYGVSADLAGKPIFNFHSIDLGTRVLRPTANAERGVGEYVAAGTEGVYFVSNDGVWVTTGGEPSLLSGDLAPLAGSRAIIGPAAVTLGDLRWSDVKGLAFHADAVYVGLGEESITRLLKLDLRTLDWTVFSAALNSMAPWNEETVTHRMRLFFSASDPAHKHICFYTPASDVDPTVAMEPRWQSGFYGIEDEDEKTLVGMKLWGSGEVTVKVAEDFGALDAGAVFQLPAAPAVGQRQRQRGQSATFFSHQLSGAAPWSVHRVDRYLRETRVPRTEKP